jgi:hypothetical protein
MQCTIPGPDDITAPVVVIIYPYTGSVISGVISIAVESSDENEIERVWCYVDGEVEGSSGNSNPRFEVDMSIWADDQEHAIQAAARDKDGNVGFSNQVIVIISATDDIVPPNVEIINPLAGQTISETDTILVLVSASDDRIVEEVAFFIDGDSVYSDSIYPYEYFWPVGEIVVAGEHTITAKAFDGAGNWTVSSGTSVIVLPNRDSTPPTIVMLNPVPNAGQLQSGTVEVSVDATDNKELDQVEFYIDGALVSTVNAKITNSPYTYLWNTTSYESNTQHTLFVKAYDVTGNSASVGPISYTIVSNDITPPTIVLLNPISGTGQVLSGIVNVRIDAEDNQELERVEFYVDGGLVLTVDASTTSSPFTYLWNTTTYGNNTQHTLFFKAYDVAGNSTSTTPISFTIVSTDIEPPTIVLLYPVPSQTSILTGTVTVSLDVTDNVGVSRVEFYIDGGINGDPNHVLTNPPWNYTWNTAPLADGALHTLYIRALDISGNIGSNGPNAFLIQ